MRACWRETIILTCVAMLSLATGCTRNVASLVRSIRYVGSDADWIVEAISNRDQDCLITIITDPEWNRIVLRVRFIMGDAVVCEETIRAGGLAGQEDELIREKLYLVNGKDAVAVFRNLYRLASSGHRYTSEDWLDNSSSPGGTYTINTGRTTRMTVDESGPWTGMLESLADEWDDRLEMDLQIDNVSPGRRFLRTGVYASFAQFVTLAVARFDTVSTVLAAAEQGLASIQHQGAETEEHCRTRDRQTYVRLHFPAKASGIDERSHP